MDKPEWISRARQVHDLTVDAGFVISESFFCGPANGFTPESWERDREPFYQPAIPLTHGLALTADVIARPDELAKYYQDVLRMAARHGKSIREQEHYFWMRPHIFSRSDAGICIPFPWYDTSKESAILLEAILEDGDGLLYDDVEQGWTFDLYAEGDCVSLRHGCLDTGGEYSVFAVSRSALTNQAAGARQRMDQILVHLVAGLGKDYWTKKSWYP